MPPATIASVITSTRKTLRTDHSMRRPSMSVPRVAGGGGRSLLRDGWHGMTSVRVGGAIARLAYWFLAGARGRSEEHQSELQSLMRTSYAVFCMKKTNTSHNDTNIEK